MIAKPHTYSSERDPSMSTLTIAVDLAKTVFELAITNHAGTVIERKRLTRGQFERFWCLQPPCQVVMEACAGAHFWGRYLMERGFTVKLLPPAYVRPYRRRSKTDRVDCGAILEANRCPDIHSVSIKSEDQQALVALHRVRSQWMASRTARINTIRALLHEFGVTTPQGPKRLLNSLHELLAVAAPNLPRHVQLVIANLRAEVTDIDRRVEELEENLAAVAAADPVVQRLLQIPGVGLLSATALYASVADISTFKSGRHFACWLGLTPREFSSGKRRILGAISKQGDPYLRMLLVHGARAALSAARRAQLAEKPLTHLQAWALERSSVVHHNKAAVALANKIARVVWAIWYHERSFDGNHAAAA